MTALSPFHARTAGLNAKQSWSEWATYLAPAGYADMHDIEYTAVREAAAVFDVSPLCKYVVSGPDAVRLVDRVITRDAARLEVGQVAYTPWCDEAGKVIDDGTVARLDETRFRWTAADPQYRWLRMNAAGLDVEIEDVTDAVAALALQGPRSRGVLEAATGEEWGSLRYFRRRACVIAGVDVDVSRTGYTGDLGYELWIPAAAAVAVWDALFAAGEQHGIRPAGLRALDVVRVEAGLILIEVDYTSAFRATTSDHEYSPFEIGLGRLVNFEKPSFVGRRALLRERSRGGPRRRLVGLELDWIGIERAFAKHDLPPAVSATVSREPVPVLSRRGQVGRATSTCWSPLLKKMVALASVGPRHSEAGTPLEVEWSVEGERGRVGATVVELPFLDLPRRRAIV
ncbi:MAG TPA: aminomethyltransferase family protein [Gaiellales bacterium]|nr:aminomethyltransferase family protein [Gaiellales bacterium]